VDALLTGSEPRPFTAFLSPVHDLLPYQLSISPLVLFGFDGGSCCERDIALRSHLGVSHYLCCSSPRIKRARPVPTLGFRLIFILTRQSFAVGIPYHQQHTVLGRDAPHACLTSDLLPDTTRAVIAPTVGIAYAHLPSGRLIAFVKS
jgi:hypothetical protein